MKKVKFLPFKLLAFVTMLFGTKVQAQNKTTLESSLSFFSNPMQPVKPRFENVPVNAIKPLGWIRSMMLQDISEGFVGYLDELVPKIMKEDIYNTARRKNKTDIPVAGTQVLTGAPWEISMQWWGGETQGNWWDGFIRNAFLTGDKKAIAKSNEFMNRILAAQDADGYLGIYGKNLRYQQEGDNGELWAQTTLFRTMLAYYEFTGNKKVLHSVEKAMALTMAKYDANARSPFKAKTDFGGLTHGLCMTDVCETMYRLTQQKKYNAFTVYLYKEFSTYPNDRMYNDVRYEYLLQADSLFLGHSAHTYEHLRSLIAAYYNTGYSQMKTVYENALHKLNFCLLPGGAGIGDEWIAGRTANADSCAAEFCGMLELRNFYTSALQKTGDVLFADKAELLTFNSMQGARFQDGKGITYCKTDNCVVLNKKSAHSGLTEDDIRFKYSPTHADAAVCCNPNYGKDFPFYVRNMWMKADDGYAAVLYGPSTFSTFRNEIPVTINQHTNYPFSDKIDFDIITGKPLDFTIYIRKPAWSSQVAVKATCAVVTEKDGYYLVQKKWKTGDKIQVIFQNEIKPLATFTNEIGLQRGALVYAYNIPYRKEDINKYPVGDFKDFLVFATDDTYRNIKLNTVESKSSFGFSYVADEKNSNPWYKGYTGLKGKVINTKTNALEEIKLIPMGSTVLRKITFFK